MHSPIFLKSWRKKLRSCFPRLINLFLCFALLSCSSAPELPTDTSTSDTSGLASTNTFSEEAPITILGPESGPESDSLLAALEKFSEKRGVEVKYEASRFATSDLDLKVSSGEPPDLAVVAQPGRIKDFAAEGFISPLPTKVAKDATVAFDQNLLDLARYEGDLYAVPTKIDLKNVIWYSPNAFTKAGYQVPTTMEELTSLTKKIRQSGKTPWCIGMADGDATGWIFTDWVEQMMLSIHGPTVYDQWVNHEIAFNSPEVEEAVRSVAQIWFTKGNVKGGRSQIAKIGYERAGFGVLDQSCFLHRQLGSYSVNYVSEKATLGPAGTISAFVFPSFADGPNNFALTAGNFAVAFSGRPVVTELLAFLGSAEFANTRIQASSGGYLSPHRDQTIELYKSSVDQTLVQALLNSDYVRFDGSDVMPPRIGVGLFWSEGVKYVNADIDSETFLTRIEQNYPR